LSANGRKFILKSKKKIFCIFIINCGCRKFDGFKIRPTPSRKTLVASGEKYV